MEVFHREHDPLVDMLAVAVRKAGCYVRPEDSSEDSSLYAAVIPAAQRAAHALLRGGTQGLHVRVRPRSGCARQSGTDAEYDGRPALGEVPLGCASARRCHWRLWGGQRRPPQAGQGHCCCSWLEAVRAAGAEP